MKVRKLAVALALAGGLGSGMAQALGLGEIELQSWLNQPLDAEISLRQSQGVDPGDVFVNVAPEAAYQRVGLDRHHFLSKLKFEVVTGADGNLAINVSSREAFREPYLNFLVELTWPSGRLMREYAVLVDPPVYAEESGVQEQVSAPASSASPAPRQTSQRSPESARRQAQVQRAPARSAQADSFGPTGPSDTLWTIAQRMRPDNSVSMQQTMLAIQDLNPDAFMDGNINRLMRGQVLRAPTLEQIRSRTRAEATQIVAQQNQQMQSPRAVDATRTAQAETGAGQAATGSDAELRLLVADEESSGRAAEDAGSAGGDGELPGGADAGSAVAMEELEATRRENEELSSRLEDMEDQVKTLQRLLELKNSQLAEIQGMTAQEEAAPAPDGSAAEAQAVAATEAQVADAAAEEQAAMTGAEADSEAEAVVDAEAQTETNTQAEANAQAEADAQAESVMAADGEADSAAATAAVAAERQPTQQAPAAATEPQKGLFGQLVDSILGNTLYQMALGGGLILLLLILLLIARKNANREKEFYDEFNRADDEGGDDSVDLTGVAGAAASQEETTDALVEADTYMAYGRNDQAVQVLETAISREPSRADLRLKLLAVYADGQDRDAFERQYGEIAALEDEAALEQAEQLRSRLHEAEAMPSIDDLESQLRSDSFSADEMDWTLSDELKADEFESAVGEVKENEFGELESDVAEETDADDNAIDFDLSDFELESEDELDALSLETDTGTDAKVNEPADEPDLESESLDESFLDELDAELEKVSGEDDLASLDLDDSTLDELELDVSDEDLALMEEFSDAGEPVSLDEVPSLDEELGLDDAWQQADTDEVLPVVQEDLESGLDIDESELEDDDFDFLAGTDEAATKLDLARAYVEMGDSDGARDILEEVSLEGNDEQKIEAQELLKNLA